jgi:hypothetical protein
MVSDAKLIGQTRVALERASDAAKKAGEELAVAGAEFKLSGTDRAARAALMPRVKRAIAAYDELTLQVALLQKLLNKLEA